MSSDKLIEDFEKYYGKDETFSCEFFTGCEICNSTGWIDLFTYDEKNGNHLCDNPDCIEKYNKIFSTNF